jgi:pyridoxine 4-dehydrogenase
MRRHFATRRSSRFARETRHHRPRLNPEKPVLNDSTLDVTEQTNLPVNRRPIGPYSVSPIGLGAMRLTGPNAFGPPKDRDGAIAMLREAVDRGVEHIDTAQFYGPNTANELIREALHPYPDELVLISKVGARRDRHRGLLIDDQPHRLRQGIEDNLRTLGLQVLPVVNLQLMRDTAPDGFFEDQLAAMIFARDDGLVKSIGLSNVTLAHLHHALRFTEVACVQNVFNLKNRLSKPVLQECTRRKIAFVPVAPLGSGASGPNSVLGNPQVIREAGRLAITPAQVALAWLMAASPNVLLIPGMSSRHHLRENLAVAEVHLDCEAARRLSLVK